MGRQVKAIREIPIVLCVLCLAALPSEASAHPANAPAPTITNVAPTQAYNSQPTTITITGSNFVATPTARLNNIPLTNVTFVNSTTLNATVPAGLAGGVYTITVTNPDSMSASLANGFNVLWSGDGSLEPWQVVSSMTTKRYAFATVVANGYIYALGGNPTSTSDYLSTVERAAVNADGTLGSWQIVNSMTIGRQYLAAVAVNGYLYAIGGDTILGSDRNTVERAALNPDGTLGSWQLVNSMTMPRGHVAAVAMNGYIYAVGGSGNSPGWYLSSVECAAVNPDGTLGAWQLMNSMTVSRVKHAAVVANGYIYALGGFDCNDGCYYWSTVERAPVNPDGRLGPWQVVNSMTTDRNGFSAVAAAGFVYALGGYNGQQLSSVERAAVNLDGTLGSWQIVNNMTNATDTLAAVAANGYLYALEGDADYRALAGVVERARVNPPSLTGFSPLAVPFDRETPVTVRGKNFLPVPTLRLGDTTTLTVSFVSTGTLTSTIPAGLASGWYTATLTNGDGPVAALANALLVDGIPPTGSILIDGGATSAYTRTVTLTLSASDDSSGVATMAFSNDGVNFTAFEPYATSKAWNLTEGSGQKTVFAKYQDRAANVSSVVSDTITLDQTPPTGNVVINKGTTTGEGALYTTSSNVILALAATAANPSGVANFRTSTDGSNYGNWLNYVTSPTANLGSGDGEKTIYIQFRDGVGNISNVYTDTITLDTHAGSDYGLSINSGATWTNSTAVTLTIPAQAGTAEMQVSNDGGFAGVQWEPYSLNKDWQIISYGNYVIPRTVYVRFRNTVGSTSGGFSDDIILDVTAPTGSVSIVGGTSNPTVRSGKSSVTLNLSATDDVSGVGGMMLSNRADFAGATWESYATSKTWTLGVNNTVYLRYRDNAGNVSQTYSASLPGGSWTLFLPLVVK